jgi:hypothetical protein
MDSNIARKSSLVARLTVATHALKDLIYQIKEIENNNNNTPNENLLKIKKIREEMAKVGVEIDSLKKEITLLNTYNIN